MTQANHITNVIISGAGGTFGTRVVQQLLTQGKHRVSALTRPDSTSSIPPGVHTIKTVDPTDHNALVLALRGEEVLILTLAPATPLSLQKPLILAAAEAGVRYVVPNEYSLDIDDDALAEDTVMGIRAREMRRYIEEVRQAHGDTPRWIALTSSFWYEFSLAGGEIRYGFDFARRSLTLIDNGDVKICTTTWEQSARAIARLLALPIQPEAGYEGPTIGEWEDRALFVNSFTLSQKDMFASVLRVTGEKESDWTVTTEESPARFQRGVDLVKGGDMMGSALMVYTRAFYPNGGGDYSHKVANTELGLPEEDLDTATREGVRVHGEGFWEKRLAAISSRLKQT